MGQLTILALSHDSMWDIEKDKQFGKNIVEAIQSRGNPNIPSRPHGVWGTQLGPQFHSNDTLLVSIENGVIVRLSIAEQIHLKDSLARFRKKQLKQAKSI